MSWFRRIRLQWPIRLQQSVAKMESITFFSEGATGGTVTPGRVGVKFQFGEPKDRQPIASANE